MTPPRPRTTTDEARLLAGVKASPADPSLRRVYADFLEENGRTGQAAYLRASAAVAGLLTAEPLRHDDRLHERLRATALLRPLLAGVGLPWLRSVGDPGLIGEVLHGGSPGPRSSTIFVEVLEETEQTCLVGLLLTRVVRGPRGGREWPVLPGDAAARSRRTSPWGRMRKRPSAGGEVVALSFGSMRFAFWGGEDLVTRQG